MFKSLSRRAFLELSLSATLATMASGCERTSRSPSRHGEAGPPNVLFIVVDDLNGSVGCLGDLPAAKTPNIDRLARSGMLFTRAYCQAPECLPSRASAMTGLLPSTTGAYRNSEALAASARDRLGIQDSFMTHGYYAMGGGKIYHASAGSPLDQSLPWMLARLRLEDRLGSWDEYFLRRMKPIPPMEPMNFTSRALIDWGASDAPEEEFGDFKLSQWAAGRLEQRYDEPFFLGCGFFAPHTPWFAPAKYFDLYKSDEISLPPIDPNDLEDVPAIPRSWVARVPYHEFLTARDQSSDAIRGYLAIVSFTDACIGRVLDALATSPYADNTLIVLWSDHGFHLGQKQHWGKHVLWEESTRVPLIFSQPGRIPEGRCDRTVGLIDIYPTLLELCGLPPVAGLDGVSLVPLLEDPQREWDRPVLTTFKRNNHSLRSERWRYTRYADGSEELYDHDHDPGEWKNVAGDPRLAGVKADLSRWLPSTNAAPIG